MQAGYWTVSYGPSIRTWTCRECRNPIYRDEQMVARDGRKIRLFYHPQCFSGIADPRTQSHSSFHDPRYPSSCFSSAAPATKGHGKWSVLSYGYAPKNGHYSLSVPPHQSSTKMERTKETEDAMAGAKAITWGFARDEKANVAFIRNMMAEKDAQRNS